MYRKSDPLDQEKVNNKAMINKTADICVQKWVAESKAKITLKLNVAFFCVLILWVLLVIKDYTHLFNSDMCINEN